MDTRRLVPRTDVLLADPRLAEAERRLGRALVKAAVTRAQDQVRQGVIAPDETLDAALAGLPARAASLTPVINATGVLLHTNLGRAALSAAATDALLAAAGCTDVEFDLATGARGRRGRGTLAALAAAVPAAERVHVVNNNAAALVLAATALAAGRDIVISRGEMVEIGDGFRLPDLLESTGARLREVGTTNRTSVADYTAADRARTPASCSRCTRRTSGSRASPPRPPSRTWPPRCGPSVPVVADIGSGLLAPAPGAAGRARRHDRAAGWGGAGHRERRQAPRRPQAGLLLGQDALVTRLARHPLARALRVDKLTLAALEATLAGPPVPVVQALATDDIFIINRVEKVVAELVRAEVDAHPVRTQGAVGGGGAPGVPLPSAAVSVPDALTGPLRTGPAVRQGRVPAVIGRVEGGRLLLDLRAVVPPTTRR